jgi:hypothetical protein
MATQGQILGLRRDLQKKAMPFHNVFSSPEGQLVLEALKEEFDPVVLCSTPDPIGIAVRAAQRDVIKYIEEMIRLREANYDG